MTTFEQDFADAERAGANAERLAQAVVAAAKQMKRAAAEGNIAVLRKAADRLAQTVEAARQEAANARSAWPLTSEKVIALARPAVQTQSRVSQRA